jgi:tetratricopeptide (TPR) repeat protein
MLRTKFEHESGEFMALVESNLRRQKQIASIPQKRKHLFLFLTTATPVAILFLLEFGLRVFGYGPNMSLFTTEDFGGKTYHIMNPAVKSRYFNNVEFSPNTSPDYFLVPKPKGMFRIFCLGGSTTIGFPYGPVGSFSTFLRDRLKAIFPRNQIEVINLGMTATNSYTALDIVHDLMDYEPDLIIDYDGHNEFYGALGIASNESAGKVRLFTKLYLRLVHLRTFVLVRSIVRSASQLMFTEDPKKSSGTLMERLSKGQYIPLGSPEYKQALSIFKDNVNELKQACESQSIPLILSTQVSNLRDEPPFVSEFAPNLSSAAKDRFKVELQKGDDYWLSESIDSALSEFNLAISNDSSRADAHYRRARCLESLGRLVDAKREYVLARDLDQLRFRASSDFNAVIREAASGPGIYFASLEDTLASKAKDGIIGNDFILEHLHPRLEGSFLFAKVYGRIMREHGLLAESEKWEECDTISDKNLWDLKPLTTLDNVAAEVRVARLTSDWPFTQPAKISDSLLLNGDFGSIVYMLVDGKTTWERAHVAAAEYYTNIGEKDAAEKEYCALINQLHYNNSAYLALGELYGFQKKYGQGTEVLLRSLDVETSFEAYEMLGKFQLALHHPADAIPYFDQAFTFNGTPDQHTSAGFLLALSKVQSGKVDEARQLLREVLSLNPTLKDARALLNSINPSTSQ